MVGAMPLKSLHNNARFSRSSGFTLIEVAMALMVVSIILIPFLQFQRMARMTDPSVDTYDFLKNNVVPGLKSYALTNKAFPAPADPKVDFTSTDPMVTKNAGAPDTAGALGMACPGTTAGGLVCVLSLGKPVIIGTLPFQALGLPLEKGLDRYGHKYTYAVSRDHIDPSSGLAMSIGGWINIRNSSSTTPYVGNDSVNEQNNATFVVISHGEDGVGAYNQNGTRNACSASLPLEKINCDDDGAFLKLTEPYNTASASAAAETYNLNKLVTNSYFDDSIVYDVTPGTTQWTQRAQGATVASFLARDSVGAGRAAIGPQKNGWQAALEVGNTTNGGGNALAASVATPRICDTQSSPGSSSCITTASVIDPTNTSMKCGHYALSKVVKSGSGVTSAGSASCDLSPVVPVTSTTLANTIVFPCTKGAKSYNADGSITCY